jgi:hypothetical protein
MEIPEEDYDIDEWQARAPRHFQSREIRCEDTRSPELNDEEAFDDLPAEVLSDLEEDPPPMCRAKPTQTPLASVPLWADPTLDDRLNDTASLNTDALFE